jgi:hypothetical protein
MAPSTDITRAWIEHQTELVRYQCAKLELAGSVCAVVVATMGLATALIGAVTAIILALTT